MALTHLLDVLRAEAAERRSAEVARTTAEAERIRAESEVALARRRNELVSQLRHEEEESRQKTLAGARREGSRIVLKARSALLDRVRAALDVLLDGADRDPDYLKALSDDLRAASDRLPPGRGSIRARPSLATPVARAVQLLGIEAEVESADELRTGFTMFSEDGRVEVDGTLETRLRHVWPGLAVAVLAEIDR